MAYKKSTFSKMGKKKIPRKKKQNKSMSGQERAKVLSTWKDGWFESN